MWNTLEEFVEWYKAEGFPIRPPFEDSVYVTDISYSYVLYREGQYQAELYLVRANTSSPPHCHPGVENIIMVWGGNPYTDINGVAIDYPEDFNSKADDGTSKLFGMQGGKLTDSDTHAVRTGPKGAAFLSLEKWPAGVSPNSVTINWAGDPVDPLHGNIIKPL